MFPQLPLNSPTVSPMDVPDDQANLRSLASELYSGMLTKAKWKRAARLLNRKAMRLLDLQSFRSPTCARNRHYVGVQSVSIGSIEGSEGRIEDFDNSFNPIHKRSRSRWLSVASLRLAGAALPPVELIQFNGIYFVRDGHHRISVAKALGEKYIDAEVIQETC